MTAYEYLLALSVLTAPPTAAGAAPNAEALRGLRPTLQAVAVRLEILDPREVAYILARPEDFATDLNRLRQRSRELAGAPHVTDSLRFPDRATAREMLAFNRTYRQHVEIRQSVELAHWWEHQATLQEVDQLHQVWDAVQDVRCDYYYVTVRRQALQRLRELLGEPAYFRGELPPCVPVWRFPTMH